MNTTTTWQERVNYQAGEVVYYNGKRYKRIRRDLDVITTYPDISEYWQLLPEEEQIPPVSHYQCLIEERDEAVQLLTKVCEHVADKEYNTDTKGKNLAWLDQIDGLVEWWLKHKPKSERDQKLEKIASALSLDGKPNDVFRKVAERVLQALGE